MATAIHPGDALSRRQRMVYVLVLGALTALGPFTIDLYLPAFPALARDFEVSVSAIQLTLTGTTVGFAAGQLLVGPWSDHVGRRLPLAGATLLHILASVGAAISPTIFWLATARVVQGVGAAAGVVVALAMVRDLFGGQPMVRMLSRLALVSGLAPIAAPVLGSQLLRFVDWRGIFWFLAAYGVAVLIAVSLWIVETLPPQRRHLAGWDAAWNRCRLVLGDRAFLGLAVIGGMNFTALFAYLASSPFLFQNVYGFTAQQYGFLFAVNSVGVVIGIQSAAFLIRSIGPQWILAFAIPAMITSAVLITLLSGLGTGPWGTLVPLFAFIVSGGFCVPCIQVLALTNHAGQSGTAASVLGVINFGLAGVISPVVGAFGTSNAIAMGVVMAMAAMVALATLWAVVRPGKILSLSVQSP
ncbi:multidrug effflux MFS transporter [Arthrobacter sp. efr-133-R2A-120]|uniref:multidrug effflux MFS transporter n=1 Tax=Arthrobacter sp. efr-133-R2A-120 TaxID=3040277 RepID=UPI00254E09D8|nr:multidrug effflux MFS transporter [Arthrobacter sp. efr-133-R2A-120]